MPEDFEKMKRFCFPILQGIGIVGGKMQYAFVSQWDSVLSIMYRTCERDYV